MYKLLEQNKFGNPDSYAGHRPSDDYVIVNRHRDSGHLSESNFECISDHLKQKFPDLWSDKIYIFRAGHWACGWIEYLIIEHDSPTAVLEECEEILESLADYPVFNEDNFSEREWNAAQEYWKSLSIKERIELCKQADMSIFAARKEYIPQGDNGYIYESCLGY